MMMERGQVSWWTDYKGLSSLTQGWWPEETPSWKNVDILHPWPPGYDRPRERGVKEGVEGYVGHSSQSLNGLCQQHINLLTLKTEEDHCPQGKGNNIFALKVRWWTQIELKDYPAHCPTQSPTKWPPHWDEAWPTRRISRPTHRKCLLLTRGNECLSKRCKNLPPKRNYPRSMGRKTKYKTNLNLKKSIRFKEELSMEVIKWEKKNELIYLLGERWNKWKHYRDECCIKTNHKGDPS